MRREGIVTHGVDGINYNKHLKDPRIRSCWVNGGDALNEPKTGDVRQKRGPEAGHVPVICDPVVEATIAPGRDGAYVDCTFGRGGHSDAILRQLSARGKLFAFDVDPSAIAVGRMLEEADKRLRIFHRPFGDLAEAIPQDIELSGVVMDLGVSSPQLDERHRGFSVIEDGPLDLRMNPSQGIPASEWLQTVTTEELAWVIRMYGEDEDPILSARIAEEIMAHQRENGPFRRTRQLGDVIRDAKRGLDDRSQHPAKLSFQAIRTWINQEFQQFEKVLEGSFQRLKYGGRCVVICFKRAETMTLQRFIRDNEECDPDRVAGWPPEKVISAYPLLQRPNQKWCVREVCNPISPTPEEMRYNNRSRSARGHVLEKRMRTRRWQPPPGIDPAMELFVKPKTLPRFGGDPDLEAMDEEAEVEHGQRPPKGKGKSTSKSTGKSPGKSQRTLVENGATNTKVNNHERPVANGGKSIGKSVGKPAGKSPAVSTGNPVTRQQPAAQSIQDWLRSLDGGIGKLLAHQQILESRYDSVDAILKAYRSGGTFLDATFFEDIGVQKAAHRRYFERWFSEALSGEKS